MLRKAGVTLKQKKKFLIFSDFCILSSSLEGSAIFSNVSFRGCCSLRNWLVRPYAGQMIIVTAKLLTFKETSGLWVDEIKYFYL